MQHWRALRVQYVKDVREALQHLRGQLRRAVGPRGDDVPQGASRTPSGDHHRPRVRRVERNDLRDSRVIEQRDALHLEVERMGRALGAGEHRAVRRPHGEHLAGFSAAREIHRGQRVVTQAAIDHAAAEHRLAPPKLIGDRYSWNARSQRQTVLPDILAHYSRRAPTPDCVTITLDRKPAPSSHRPARTRCPPVRTRRTDRPPNLVAPRRTIGPWNNRSRRRQALKLRCWDSRSLGLTRRRCGARDRSGEEGRQRRRCPWGRSRDRRDSRPGRSR